MILSARERSDIETLYRLFGIKSLVYLEEFDDLFITKAYKCRERPFFIELNASDFPSLPKQSHSVEDLLRQF